MHAAWESSVGLGKPTARVLTAEQMMAYYVQNDAIYPLKLVGRPVLMDFRATGCIRVGILAVLLVAVGLGQQWTRLHSGHPPSGKELEALSSARSYLRVHAGEQFQRYASIVDRTTYRIVPKAGHYVAKTTQPKLFKPVVLLTKQVLDMRERFLAAVLLHESVHSTTGLFDPDETLPTQIESDFLRSVGVDASIEALKKENPATWDQYYIDTAEENFRVLGVRRPAIIAGPLPVPATIASGQNRSTQNAGTFALIPAAPARSASF
jgi:hypothetical protein